MSSENFNTELLGFLQSSPTPFHATENMARMLEEAGFQCLDEINAWDIEKNSRYFTTRNKSSLIAVKTGASKLAENGFRLAGAHTDSPCLKVKPNPEIKQQGYLQLGVEIYGGALLHPWFDRDLSLAGRVDYRTQTGELGSALVDVKEPIAIIPSLAIHLDRKANEGRPLNRQKELTPIVMQLDKDEEFVFNDFLLETVRSQSGYEEVEKILSHELVLYDVQAPALVGLRQQFIASARLDNLLSCFLGIKALLASDDTHASVLVCNDHEEVGSVSSSGAQSPFLKSVLERIVAAEDSTADAFERSIRHSLLLSIDNAHGIHPNYSDKHDDRHGPLLDAGPVIKINANQRYASNSESIAFFKTLCEAVAVPYQSFVMRNDMACGSTIGPITAAGLGITTIDVGVATFAMHSIRELAGTEDAQALADVVRTFYSR